MSLAFNTLSTRFSTISRKNNHTALDKLSYDARIGKYKKLRKGETIPFTYTNFYGDVNEFASLVEKSEDMYNKRKSDALLLRTLRVALPNNLNFEELKKLTIEISKAVYEEKKFYGHTALHLSDNNNPHIHLCWTTRKISPVSPFRLQKTKSKEYSPIDEKKLKKEDPNYITCAERLREKITELFNSFLSEKEKIDYRSYAERGIEKLPTIHEGNGINKDERKAINEEIKKQNKEIEEYGQRESESYNQGNSTVENIDCQTRQNFTNATLSYRDPEDDYRNGRGLFQHPTEEENNERDRRNIKSGIDEFCEKYIRRCETDLRKKSYEVRKSPNLKFDTIGELFRRFRNKLVYYKKRVSFLQTRIEIAIQKREARKYLEKVHKMEKRNKFKEVLTKLIPYFKIDKFKERDSLKEFDDYQKALLQEEYRKKLANFNKPILTNFSDFYLQPTVKVKNHNYENDNYENNNKEKDINENNETETYIEIDLDVENDYKETNNKNSQYLNIDNSYLAKENNYIKENSILENTNISNNNIENSDIQNTTEEYNKDFEYDDYYQEEFETEYETDPQNENNKGRER